MAESLFTESLRLQTAIKAYLIEKLITEVAPRKEAGAIHAASICTLELSSSLIWPPHNPNQMYKTEDARDKLSEETITTKLWTSDFTTASKSYKCFLERSRRNVTLYYYLEKGASLIVYESARH